MPTSVARSLPHPAFHPPVPELNLQLENLGLRHQIGVRQRSVKAREINLHRSHSRGFSIPPLARLALDVGTVKPETVVVGPAPYAENLNISLRAKCTKQFLPRLSSAEAGGDSLMCRLHPCWQFQPSAGSGVSPRTW
jgi:hypothetical protein